MEYKNLANVKMDEIVSCLSKSFEDYFVKMPSDVSFWKTKFKNARVDQSLSWGVFDNNKLIAFIINAIDEKDGNLTAFNTGTGVLPAYRGNQLVDKMYEYGLPELRKIGVRNCCLEVIDKNKIVMKVYKRIGFHTKHLLYCYKGGLSTSKNTSIKEIRLDDITDHHDSNYSWDNTMKTIRMAGSDYKIYLVFDNNNVQSIGYFIINPSNGYIAQLESPSNNWQSLFDGISQIQTKIKINNIKEDRHQLLSYLNNHHFENTINQFEMRMEVKTIQIASSN